MSNEIILNQDNLPDLISENGLGELIKPLQQEIHLFDTTVAGTTHLKDPSVLEEIAVGDQLKLLREDNPHDEMAIMIMTGGQKKLGYVPKKDNIVFSRLMDAGKLLTAKISKIEKKGNYTRITIGIYLIDF